MSQSDRINRRELLAGLGRGALLASSAPGLLTALSGCGGATATGLEDALGDFYSDRESARAVGREVLLHAPDEKDAELLARRLGGERLAEWEALATADPTRLAAALRAQHRADFQEGRVLRVRGWVLSRTEARLCALVALG